MAVACGLLWHGLAFRLAPRLGLLKPNFAGKQIVSSYGIALFGYVAPALLALSRLGLTDRYHAKLYLATMGAMCVFGAIDDIFGSREVGGFKGHFRKLLLERKLTTGAVKALGGGVVGVIAGYFVSGGDAPRWIAAALLIPLSANMLNLVDLRPGRAVAVFFCGLGVTCIVAGGTVAAPWVVAAVAAITAAFAFADSRGLAMMGDSGSNALGAAMGLSMVINAELAVQIGAIVCFVAIHWYSERHSITRLIERNPVLRAIDSKLGVR